MLVLGIESTCDETGCAVVRNGKEILSNIVASQTDLHIAYGGVVPELACRRHIEVCLPILKKALKEAKVTLKEIDLISVAHGPGLIGAILIGVNFAKGLAFSTNKPFIGVNHVEAHLYSSLMEFDAPLPALGVVISGGHTALVLVKGIGDYTMIGQTQDDAIGEAFDKVATLLQLPYPGGPQIEALAKLGDPSRFPFKAGTVKNRPFDFSFSGLKTAVLYRVKGQNATKLSPSLMSEDEKKDIAASFQQTAFMDLIEKALLAAKKYQCQSIILGGGVTHNRYLRSLFKTLSPYPIFFPPEGLSLDNAAMIAGLGFHLFKKRGKGDTFDLEAKPRFPIDQDPNPLPSPMCELSTQARFTP